MNATSTHKMLCIIAGLAMGLMVTAPSWAAFGGSPAQPIKGTVQSIDYLHHAITVNGQTYAVAQNASYSGVASFSVLHIGMPIAYVLGSSPPLGNSADDQDAHVLPPGPAIGDPGMTQTDSAPPVITSITWLPRGV